jgi:hypothetical protein
MNPPGAHAEQDRCVADVGVVLEVPFGHGNSVTLEGSRAKCPQRRDI